MSDQDVKILLQNSRAIIGSRRAGNCVVGHSDKNTPSRSITKIIRYKARGAADDGEEIYGDVMVQLVGRLQKLNSAPDERKIEDFDSYVRPSPLTTPATAF